MDSCKKRVLASKRLVTKLLESHIFILCHGDPREIALSEAHRLPKVKGSHWLFEGPTGMIFARPWFDRWTYQMLAKRMFPLSRLWAAAMISGDDVVTFRDESQISRLDSAEEDFARALMRDTQAALAGKYTAAEKWEAVFFGENRPGDRELVAVEVERRAAAAEFLGQRFKFRPLLAGRSIGAVRFDTPSQDEIVGTYGDWMADPDSAYPAPEILPEIEVSHSVSAANGSVSWLKFPSPGRVVKDTSWAKIVEPHDASNAPTLLYCHGLGEETELRNRFLDETPPLIAMGVRVIRLEAPWHNRRFVPGRWSGEPFLGRAPGGPMNLFDAHVRELAILTQWCRTRYGTPVAIGGLSMGALTAQLAAYRANFWPKAMQPDALFLAAVSEDMWEICFDGSIGSNAGVGASVRRAGWTDEPLERVRMLTNPTGRPVMDPSRIVMKLALSDDVMPYARGRSLAERWGLPAENVFERNQGHFTVPISMVRNARAFRRLAEILHRL
jgi:hypothetical protein